jgi:hypothetical protein
MKVVGVVQSAHSQWLDGKRSVVIYFEICRIVAANKFGQIVVCSRWGFPWFDSRNVQEVCFVSVLITFYNEQSHVAARALHAGRFLCNCDVPVKMTLSVGDAILICTHAHTKGLQPNHFVFVVTHGWPALPRQLPPGRLYWTTFTTKLATNITVMWFLWHFVVDKQIIAERCCIDSLSLTCADRAHGSDKLIMSPTIQR